MNKNYIKSDNINIFPCGNRANYPHNRWLTEYNLVSIVNRLVDADTFVVTHNLEVVNAEGKPNLDQEFTFNISGYIVTTKLNDIDLLVRSSISDKAYEDLYIVASIDVKNVVAADSYLTSTTSGSPFLSSTDSETEDLDKMYNDEAGIKTMYFTGVRFTVSKLSSIANVDLKHLLPVLQVERVSTDKETIYYKIPESSKIKFETNSQGTRRSIKLDDGVLGSS